MTHPLRAKWHLIKAYAQYQLKARTVQYIHSPFLFELMQAVWDETHWFSTFDVLEAERKNLRKSTEILSYIDPGAGSLVSKGNTRKVSDIARYALQPPQYARFLFRLALHLKPQSIIELGTSLGLTTLYLSEAVRCPIFTLEGAEPVAQKAQQLFQLKNATHIQLVTGLFENTFPQVLTQIQTPTLIIFDGNHQKQATWQYFETALHFADQDTCFVFDDIHWSPEMEQVWGEIIAHPAVTLSFDIFKMGVVFFNKNLSKQHFILRY